MIIFTPKQPDKAPDKAHWNGDKVEWGDNWQGKPVNPLTEIEKSALQAKYRKIGRGRKPNYERAFEVKTLMSRGVSLSEIIRILRPKKRGYGERSIKYDHASLTTTLPK